MANSRVPAYRLPAVGSAQSTVYRLSSAILGLGLIGLMIGFGYRQSWATDLWQWDDERMSFIFLASIAAAVAAPALWVAVTGEFAAWSGVVLNGTVVGTLASTYLLSRAIRGLEPNALPALIVFAVFTAVALVVFRQTHGYPLKDPRAMPRFVRAWFAVFASILIGAGSALLFQVDRVFPWNLTPATSTLFGCFFIGAAAYFMYAIWLDRWMIAAGALWSFLAYDIVLATPYLDLLQNRNDRSGSGTGGLYGYSASGGVVEVNELSLSIYLTVLGVSSLVAIYALLIHPASRVWRRS